MISKVFDFIKRPTSRDVIVNTIGNYLNVVFTAFFALVLVRILDPSQYGVLSVLLGIAYVLANILDFGTTATIYSYLPPLYNQKSEDLYKFIKSTFFYQSIFSVVVITLLFIFFPYMDKVFFKTGAPLSDLYLTSISVLFFIWQNFISNCMFAAKHFMKANIYNNASNLIKTLIILYLMFTHNVTVSSVIFVFGILGPLIFFLLLFIEKRELVYILYKSKIDKEEFRFKYTLTYFIGAQFLNLGLRMDLFLLSYFRSKAEVGFYGLSQKIILTIITTIISITQVLSPAFSNIKSKREVISQMKTGFLYLLIPSSLFLLLYLTPTWVFTLFFTDTFAQTARITKALSLSFIINALSNLPLLFLLYTVKKPRYILVANIAFFIVLTGMCYYLIPQKGVMGPPIAVAVAFIVNTVILTIAAFYEYHRMED
ncbi:MAG: hypothetical protein RI947_661 [Candidatus Parcubacteria bacterium]|jgi:O-antigen/teichoic acid export membrane protein